MRVVLSLVLLVALVPAFEAVAGAQSADDQNALSVAENVADLRAQLVELQAREAELQARASQLDEDMKPENIERSLAGVGSTRPEELREQVRRELSIQREGVRAQLRIITTSRERLESVIRTAENVAYQQSAEQASLNPTMMLQALGSARWLIAGIVSLVAILLVVLAIGLRRRARTT